MANFDPIRPVVLDEIYNQVCTNDPVLASELLSHTPSAVAGSTEVACDGCSLWDRPREGGVRDSEPNGPPPWRPYIYCPVRTAFGPLRHCMAFRGAGGTQEGSGCTLGGGETKNKYPREIP
jgi:hypothetical protein